MKHVLSANLLLLKRLIFLVIPFALIMMTNLGRVNHQTFKSTDESVLGVLQYLPADYYDNSDKYPVIIFLHGFYERGVFSRDAEWLQGSIQDVDNIGVPRTIRKGHKFPFIVVSPQLKHRFERWPLPHIMEAVNWAKNTLRVDEKRIHITGLSLGGGGTFMAIQEYPELFASAAPVCPNWNDPSRAPAIAHGDVAVWAFHGEVDEQVPLHTTMYMIDSINRSGELTHKAKVRVYEGARHAIWDRAYTADHSEQSPNLYEWMMSIVKTRVGDNYLPTAFAGDDLVVSRESQVTLTGSGSDTDGEITSYRWSQMYGPPAELRTPDKSETPVSISRPGVYMFRLTVTDNKGATDTDYVRLEVR